MSVALRLSKEVRKQINDLEPNRLSTLRKFLSRLSENPFAAEIVKAAQVDEYERYAYKSPGQYIVYWRMISVRTDDEVVHVDMRDWRIELLQIAVLR